MEALVIALVVFVGAIAGVVLLFRRLGPSSFQTEHVSQKSPELLFPRVLAEFGRLTGVGYELTSHSGLGVTLARRFRPWWLIFPIVLLFPIGLLALIYRQTYSVTVTLSPEGRMTSVTVVGFGPRQLRDFSDATAAELAYHPR